LRNEVGEGREVDGVGEEESGGVDAEGVPSGVGVRDTVLYVEGESGVESRGIG
jgi:hypothetical protein